METTAEILGQALHLHRDGDFVAARDLYRKVLAADPENCDALHLLSLILARIDKRYAEALTMIGTALRRNPQFAAAAANRDAMLTQALIRCRELAAQGDGWAEIADICAAAVAQRPGIAPFHFLAAQAAFFLGQPEECAAAAQRALRIAPNNSDIRDNLLKLLESVIHAAANGTQCAAAAPLAAETIGFLQGVGDWVRLEQAARVILRLDPTNGDAWLTLAHVADAGGRYPAVRAYAERAAPSHPRRAAALRLSGHSRFAEQDFPAAERDYRAALALAPNDAEAAAGVANSARHQQLAAGAPDKIRLNGRTKIFIVTYNDIPSLQRNLTTLLNTLETPDVTVVNNHPDPVDAFVPAGVRVLNNTLRHPKSRGHLARSWNQALLFGFGKAAAPECDWVIGMQDDLVVSPALWRLFEAEKPHFDFMMIGPGDQFWAANPTAVGKIGLWDECLTSIVFQDADYYHRAYLALGERALLEDHSHQPPGDTLIRTSQLALHRLLHGAVATDNQARLLRSPPGSTHQAQFAYFQKKWETKLNPHNFQISRDRSSPAPETFCFYPWFFE